MVDEPVVHLIDDDDAVRNSLAFLLSTGGFAVRTYESAVSFLEALPDVPSGCVVTDVRMPEIDGLELQRRLRAMNVELPVIVITGHGDLALAVEAMRSGAVHFIEKPFDDEVLLDAVNTALDPERHGRKDDAARAEIRNRLASLSEREHQVLEGLVAGLPNKIIAHDLGTDAQTVEVHRANLMTKMQASTLSELVRMALLAGIDPENRRAVRPDGSPKA